MLPRSDTATPNRKNFMESSIADLAPRERYRLLVGLVVPRPIALITSRGAGGIENAAPFSFFNLLGEDPAIVVVSFNPRADGTPKDTPRNIAETGEFVVNLVDEDLAEAMHLCSLAYPPEESEVDIAGLTLLASRQVKPGRLAEAPASLECRLVQTVKLGERTIVLGEVVHLHIRDALVDAGAKTIRLDAYRPIGRMLGNVYCRTRERFLLPGGG